jgi:putative SOS response-associated peptidase YedK
VPFWAKDPKIGYKLINARSETVAVKPSFRNAFKTQRCLVPANGYVEWKGEGEAKQPYYFQLRSKESFAIAGLFDVWKDAEERPMETYTLLTMEAQGMAKEVHHRMPVILSRENESRWVDRELTEAEEIRS